MWNTIDEMLQAEREDTVIRLMLPDNEHELTQHCRMLVHMLKPVDFRVFAAMLKMLDTCSQAQIDNHLNMWISEEKYAEVIEVLQLWVRGDRKPYPYTMNGFLLDEYRRRLFS